MAVPKYKMSKSRSRKRNASVFFATTDALTKCPQCHAVRKPHTVCGNCGFYKGAQRVEVAKDKEKKSS